MSIVRHDPFREMFTFQDQLSRFLGAPRREENLSTSAFPAVDIFEDGEGLTLTAELPGVDPKVVDVKIENQVLTLSGERKLEREEQRDSYHRIESWFGSFTRSFSLPTTVDVDKVRAEHKNGLLRVFLPRREETKPRRVSVKIEA